MEHGTLNANEPHPAIESAKTYIASLGFEKLYLYLESFSSCAIENNRLGEICAETLRRYLAHEPISDRYFFGIS